MCERNCLRSVSQSPFALNAVARAETQQDVRSQLARLIYAGFVLTTPWSQLRELPRYLKAVQHRLAKAPQDPGRDLKLLRELAVVEEPYWRAVRAEQGHLVPERDSFRWLLEEYRVSLFAQQLKTAVAVSARRLSDAWQARAK